MQMCFPNGTSSRLISIQYSQRHDLELVGQLLLLERDHGRFGRARLHVTPAVRDAMHVDVYTDSLGPARHAHRQVGALGPNTAE